jgi:hypothetical protein
VDSTDGAPEGDADGFSPNYLAAVSGNVSLGVLTAAISGNTTTPMSVSGNNDTTTARVRRHRATAGMIRVEVEVPMREDALAVRRFALARRRAGDWVSPMPADASPAPAATTLNDLPALLAGMDAARQAIALQFAQALTQTTEPDMLARGRRVALNFADAVAQRRRDEAIRDENGEP